MKICLSLILFISINLSLHSQKCNCTENFEWLRTTFEENDAGFQYIINKKGTEAYNQHTESILNRIKKINEIDLCRDEFENWLHFFRKSHIEIHVVREDNAVANTNIPIHEIDVDSFMPLMLTKSKLDIEGFWRLAGYEMAIQKVGDKYVASILHSKNEAWKKNEVKMTFSQDGSGVFYMGDKSKRTINEVELITENLLRIDDSYLTRTLQNSDLKNAEIQDFLRIVNDAETFGYPRDNKNFYFRIHSFHHTNKSVIDSILSLNKDTILSTENLIIDLRGNGGGSDASFAELIPFIYTHPIRTIGVMTLSTELNNNKIQDILNGKYGELPDEDKLEFEKMHQSLNDNIGKFISMESETVHIDSLDVMHSLPMNVAIIIDNGVASTAEQFLLAAKQSTKVKLFGRTTTGALDISNLNLAYSPSNEFVLVYGTSKSKRIPQLTIDDKGIQPDIFLDQSIPEYKWVEFVSKYYK